MQHMHASLERPAYRLNCAACTTSPLPPPRPPLPPAKARDPWFDNAKMTLVVLVVVGHSWTLLPLRRRRCTSWLYDFLYSWHIPAFVIVTGYLSEVLRVDPRADVVAGDDRGRALRALRGPLRLFRHEVGGVHFERLWADPHWPMWYLSALFFWRLMTPIFKRVPAKVVVAVAISLVAGLYATDLFDNARIFGLLPFFVLGLKMHEGHWNLLAPAGPGGTASRSLLGLFVLAKFTESWFETEWFYYRTRYDALEPDDLRALVIRMSLLLSGLVGAFAFFAVVPRTKTWFSALGSATLVVYLFHGFVVLGAEFAATPAGRPDAHALGAVPGHRLRRRAGAVPGLDPGLVDAELGRRPVGSLQRHRAARERARPSSAAGSIGVGVVRVGHRPGRVGARSGPHVGSTALNGTSSRCTAWCRSGACPPRWCGYHVASSPGRGRWCGSRCRSSSRSVRAWPRSRVRSDEVVVGPDVRSARRRPGRPDGRGSGRSAARGRRRRGSAGCPRSPPAPPAPRSPGPARPPAHQRPDGVGVGDAGLGEDADHLPLLAAGAASAGRRAPARPGPPARAPSGPSNHGTTGTSQTSSRVMNRT